MYCYSSRVGINPTSLKNSSQYSVEMFRVKDGILPNTVPHHHYYDTSNKKKKKLGSYLLYIPQDYTSLPLTIKLLNKTVSRTKPLIRGVYTKALKETTENRSKI